jgi:hypothetical protein
VSKDIQLKDLARSSARIVVGTPGRILDLVNDGTCNLKQCVFFLSCNPLCLSSQCELSGPRRGGRDSRTTSAPSSHTQSITSQSPSQPTNQRPHATGNAETLRIGAESRNQRVHEFTNFDPQTKKSFIDTQEILSKHLLRYVTAGSRGLSSLIQTCRHRTHMVPGLLNVWRARWMSSVLGYSDTSVHCRSRWHFSSSASFSSETSMSKGKCKEGPLID